MGSRISLRNRVEIAERTINNGRLTYYGYRDLTDELIEEIIKNPMVQHIQISRSLPKEAFLLIDKILSKRSDLFFRIYGLYGLQSFDLSCLCFLTHLRNLSLDVVLKGWNEPLDCNILCGLEKLQSVRLNLFDLKDYSFVKGLTAKLKSLQIFADTMNGSVNFDCEWLCRFEELQTLYLGKKVRKHINSISQLPKLKNLTLRGIKLSDFEFLRKNNLQALAIHWCGMNNLNSLTGFTSLKQLELWRIAKLEDPL